MDAVEIEHCLEEIISEFEILNYDNPITYLIFLDRYKHMLSPVQIENTENMIATLKHRINVITNINLKKFEMQSEQEIQNNQ